MKKIFLLLVVATFIVSANAQLLLNETFDYNSTVLCNVAGDPNANADPYNVLKTWYKTGKSADASSGATSMKLVAEPLFYPGYINSGLGKAVKIDMGASGAEYRADVCRFIEHANKIKTGMLYYAFLLQVNDAHSFSTATGTDASDWRDVFCIAEGGSDILGNSYRGRFFIQVNPDDATKVNYTMVKNLSLSSTITPANIGTISAGQAYLVVIKQNFTTNSVEVAVNPVIQATEPTTGWITGSTSADDGNTFGGTYGVAIRRRNMGSTSDVQIAGLRVAYTYADAVGIQTALVNTLENNKNIKAIAKTIVTDESGQLSVYNLSGARMLSVQTQGRYETSLNKGMYLVRFVNNEGVVSSAKVEIK